jgi:hypothetical protein
MEEFDEKKIEQVRLEYLKDRNLEGLLNVALLKWKNLGCLETCNDYFPEICYYFGRLHDIEEFSSFLREHSFIVNSLPYETVEMGKALSDIGHKFPFLEESDLCYLESLYTDSRIYQFMKYMMFDEDRLPRSLDKYDLSKLCIKNTDFSEELLLEVFDCFELNDGIDETWDDCYVYNRELNEVIEKPYGQISLTESYISSYTNYKKCIEICIEIYGEKIEEKLIEIINSDYSHLGGVSPNQNLTPNSLLRYVMEVDLLETKDETKLNELKKAISLDWLAKVNNKIIDR